MKILAIVPYPELGTLIQEAASRYPDMEVSIFHGYYGNAMAYLTAFPREHFDMIISRGGTATLLMEKVKIPVIDIRIGTLDILRVLLQSGQFRSRTAVITYRDIAEQFRTLADYLQIDISVYPFDTPDAIDVLADRCRADGCRVVIGGAMARDAAAARGLQFLLLTSGHEAVADCVAQAHRTHETNRVLTERAALFQALADGNDDPVFLLDAQSSLRFANSAAWEMMDASPSALPRITDTVPMIREGSPLHIVKKIGRFYYKMNGRTFRIGAEQFFAFDLHFRSPDYRQASFMRLRSPEETENEILSCPYTALLTEPYEGDLTAVFQDDMSVHIRGEVGTKKDLFALIVHSRCNASASLIHISCRNLTEKGWEALLEKPGSPLHAAGYTIFFEDIDTLPLQLQSSLLAYMNDTLLPQRHRIISCAHTDLSEEVSKGHFLSGLYRQLCGYTISMVPLSGRKKDIPSFLSLILSSYTEHSGHSVIGFTPEALSFLTNYGWPLNLVQAETILRQLAAQSDSAYITADAAEAVTRGAPDRATLTAFDLSGTLDEIEKRVIEKVLKEENMNQSAAAKRLGIGRSTLWRKLQ